VRLNDQELILLAKLLDEALDVPGESQEAWLSSLAEPNAKLRDTLRDLLASRAAVETNDFLETLPPLGNAQVSHALQGGPTGLQPGAAVGPYGLIREVGRGGMGIVWLAQRSDGQIKRPVALKLPYFAPYDQTFAGRFARERDILAALTHPNIARLYDAGITDQGQSYLAIEYVEGVSLTEYCDAQRLSVRRRLEIFQQVLDAVQYAHSHLVIHRDLKPSNILVTARNQVALLDFGIAKLLIDGEAKETELTRFGGRALTPNYASPEQIAGEPLSTASDIYSLGVVLYELLTGTLPYKLKRDSRGSLEEAILEVDPIRPSQSAKDPRCAANRTTSPGKLAKTLSGDLDTVVLKALKKSPTARYLTAQAFGEDIVRFLHGQPVTAQPDSATYRASKFLRRNKVIVGAVAAVAAALAVGLGIALWQAQLARTEATRAQVVQGFLVDIFRANAVDQSDPQKGRHTTAEELLDVGAKQVSEKLADSPQAEEQVMDTLADMYFQLGLGDQAANMRLRRIEVLRRAYGARDARVADALLYYAQDLQDTTNRGELPAILNEVKTILDARHDFTSPLRGELFLALSRYFRYANLGESRNYADQAVEFFRRSDPEGDIEDALRSAGKSRDLLGDYASALELHQQAFDEARKLHPGKDAWLIVPLSELGDCQAGLMNVVEAEKNLRAAVELARKTAGEGRVQTVHAERGLGRFLYNTSRRQEGRALILDALDVLRRGDTRASSGLLPEVMGYYGAMLVGDGRPSEAEPYLAADVDDLRKNYPGSHVLARRLASQGDMLTDLGRYDDAGKVLKEALDTWSATTGSAAEPATYNQFLLSQARLSLAVRNPEVAVETLKRIALPSNARQLPLLLDDINAKIQLAQAYLQQDRVVDALDVANAALDHVQHSSLRIYYQTFEADALLWLGEAQSRAGNLSAAGANLERALTLREMSDDQNSPRIAELQVAFANYLFATHHSGQAKTLLAKAEAVQRAHRELGDHFKRPLRELQARLAVPAT
jgi:eukaryotic-like serine/threonine-protein kinase